MEQAEGKNYARQSSVHGEAGWQGKGTRRQASRAIQGKNGPGQVKYKEQKDKAQTVVR